MEKQAESCHNVIFLALLAGLLESYRPRNMITFLEKCLLAVKKKEIYYRLLQSSLAQRLELTASLFNQRCLPTALKLFYYLYNYM